METITMTQQQVQATAAIINLVKNSGRYEDIISLGAPIRIDWFNDSIEAVQVFDDDVVEVYMATPGELLWDDINADVMWKIHADLERQLKN